MRKTVAIFLVMPFSLVFVLSTAALSSSLDYTFHQHHLSLFAGNTQEDFDEIGFTIGADYEYRINALFGAGATIEYAGGDFGHWAGFVSMVFHPFGNWQLILAPGMEIDKGKLERDFIFRTGGGYQFHLNENFTITPEFFIDFSDGERLYIYGVSIGFGF